MRILKTNILSTTLLLSVLLIASSCNDPGASDGLDGDIFGKVIDSTSQEAISGVVINLVESDQSAITDSDGNFEFETVPNGEYTLLAQGKTYIPTFQAASKVDAHQLEKDFSLVQSASGNSDLIELNVGQSLSVDGVDITFSEVSSDSRCANGVQCVWAGSGRAALDLSTLGQTLRIFVDTNDLNDFSSTVEALGMVLTLDALLPHPEIDSTIDPSDYKITLRVNDK